MNYIKTKITLSTVIFYLAALSSAKAGFGDPSLFPTYPVPETLSIVSALGMVVLGLFLLKKKVGKR